MFLKGKKKWVSVFCPMQINFVSSYHDLTTSISFNFFLPKIRSTFLLCQNILSQPVDRIQLVYILKIILFYILWIFSLYRCVAVLIWKTPVHIVCQLVSIIVRHFSLFQSYFSFHLFILRPENIWGEENGWDIGLALNRITIEMDLVPI